MTFQIATIDDVRKAEKVVRDYISPSPLIRSYPLERELGLKNGRRVWLKDYGWTPSGSFKLMGALNWMANNAERIGDQSVTACSSGNFASGLAFAGEQFGKQVIIVMPETAPEVKFNLTRSFGADIRTYDITTDHKTGKREQLTRQIAEEEKAIQASPYDDNHVIAGNGVGGLEIAQQLGEQRRIASHFYCQVSGGGLMAGHAIAMADAFPNAKLIGVEPENANDFCQSLATNKRTRIDLPRSICDGLLSYDVGEHNWPILSKLVTRATSVPDSKTRSAMCWLYEHHGLRTEPSGAIALAAVLDDSLNGENIDGEGDFVIVVSGRNVDEASFRDWIA